MNLKEAINKVITNGPQYWSRRSAEGEVQESFFREVNQDTGRVIRQGDPGVIRAVRWVTEEATEDSVKEALK